MTLLGEDKAEPDNAIAVAGGVASAASGAAVHGNIAKAATTNHMARPTRADRISLRTATVKNKPIMTPLPHVAAHVIDAQLVGRLRCNRKSPKMVWECVCMCFKIPRNITKRITAAVNVALALDASFGGELPLCFRRQAEMLTRKLVELSDKSLAIIPADRLYGQIIALKAARIATHHSLPQSLGNLRLANVVATQGNIVDRLFPIFSIIAAHLEGAALNTHHLKFHAINHENTIFQWLQIHPLRRWSGRLRGLPMRDRCPRIDIWLRHRLCRSGNFWWHLRHVLFSHCNY